MAQTILDAKVVSLLVSGSTPTIYVDCRVRMPISEYTTFIATGTLTNSVPTAETTYVAARVTAGSTSPG